jgi:hypothetical protein
MRMFGRNEVLGAASNSGGRPSQMVVGLLIALVLVLGACTADSGPLAPAASPSAPGAGATVAPGEDPTDEPVVPPTAPPDANVPPCDLLAPHELTELTDAAFGSGEPTANGCQWTTETRGGYALTITLDTSTDPPTVEVLTDDPAIDGDALAGALSPLVAQRQSAGVAAPTPFAGPGLGSGGEIDACVLFTPEEVGDLLGLKMKLYGSVTPPNCGWMSDDPARILPVAEVSFEGGALDDILRNWDAEAIERAGLPGYEYGYETTFSEAAYLTLDLGDGLLTVHAISDLPEVDAMEVVRTMADKVLAAAGYTD